MRPQSSHPSVSLCFYSARLAVAALLFTALCAHAAVPPASCDVPLPATAQYPALFQKDIDATHDFVLQVRRLHPPSGWYVQIGYLALDSSGTPLAINPTLVATRGSSMQFTFVNCLGEDEIGWLTRYNHLDPASPFTKVDGTFNAFPADEMAPTGYINVHTHGMHGAPTAGTPTTNAGDEVLATFVSPVSRPFSEATVSDHQHYVITVPAKQDPGLYWYHPHLHGEAQPQVFLGLTGAIRVLRKHPGDPSGAATIAAEIGAHSDPTAHPSVFVVRDYPVLPCTDPDSPDHPCAAGAQPSPAAMSARATRVNAGGAQGVNRVRRHREQFLESTYGGRAGGPPQTDSLTQHSALPETSPTAHNPRCALVDSADGSSLCLPDAVSPDLTKPATPPPGLATLVTVNGRQTDLPSPADSGSPSLLSFQPLTPGTVDHVLRVLNASANTYVKLSLSPNPLSSVNLDVAYAGSVLPIKLTQLRRDGAPVPSANRSVDYILLPPGGRAEFKPAGSATTRLSLVSQFFYTGPAGDLVPPRTLVTLPSTGNATSAKLLAPSAAMAAEEPTAEKSERFPNVYTAHPHATHRALAFFEQDRPCDSPSVDCGTTFYLLDITAAAIGSNGTKTPLTEAHGFALPMGMLNGNPIPVRDLFDTPNGRFKATVPSIQVNLKNQPEVDEEWDVYNFTGEAHAFHIHQLGFFVDTACSPAYLQATGHSPDCRSITSRIGDENHETGLLLDVINLAPAVSVPSADSLQSVVYPAKVHLRVPFTQGIAGNFVMHCHLLEHEDNGMMMGVQVWPNMAPAPAAASGPGGSTGGMHMH